MQSATNPASSSSQSDNEDLFIQAVGGFDKKGRVFGLGASASRVRASKRSSSDVGGVSAGKCNTFATNYFTLSLLGPFKLSMKIKLTS